MYKLIIPVILILTFSQNTLIAQDTPQILIEKFFKQYKSLGIPAALDSLYSTNKWISNSQDMVIQLKSKMVTELGNVDYVGEMYGHEALVMKSLNSSLKLYSYLVKYDRQPVRFTFQFYKPNDKWMIYSFQYDANLPDELEESAKMYYELNKY